MVITSYKFPSKFFRASYKTIRTKKNFNPDDFKFVLNMILDDSVLYLTDPEDQVKKLTTAMYMAADISCPLKTFEFKKTNCQWVTKELLDHIYYRNMYYKEYIKNR